MGNTKPLLPCITYRALPFDMERTLQVNNSAKKNKWINGVSLEMPTTGLGRLA
jgi:hypothetical protein